MSLNLLDPVTAAIDKVLDLRTRQQAMAAANLANADTPGYKARHVDFGKSLSRLLRQQASQPARTHAAHMGDESSRAVVVRTVEPHPWAADGNSVDPQREMAVLTENQLLYNASIEIFNRRLGVLRYAVSEGK
jgi:flagellar basal-body rod protein FlgB